MTESPYEILARALRQRRKALGLTQAELGALAGCGRLFVGRLETCKSSLRMDKVLDVLEVLGLRFELHTGPGPLTDEVGDARD